MANQITGSIQNTNIEWEYDSDIKQLLISGSGVIPDYDTSANRPPWENYGNLMESVIIENGITRIGDLTFYNYENLQNIILPSSLNEIGAAFYGCVQLTSLSIPTGVWYIHDEALLDSGVSKIYIPYEKDFFEKHVFGYGAAFQDIDVVPLHTMALIYDEYVTSKDGYEYKHHKTLFPCYNDAKLSANKHKTTNVIETMGSKFPFVISNTQAKYSMGDFSGCFYEIKNGEFDITDNVKYRKELIDFLLNGKAKVLEYYDGRKYKIMVTGEEISEEQGDSIDHIFLKFSWTEIGDI